MKTTAKRRITGIGAVAMTEFSDLDPDTLHLVRNAANGFPALLAKSIAGEVRAAKSEAKLPREVVEQIDAQRKHRNNARRQRDAAARTHQEGEAAKTAQRTQEAPNVKKQKKRKIRQVTTWPVVRKSQAQLEKELLVKSVANAVVVRINELEHQLAKSGGGQNAYGIQRLLYKEHERFDRFAKGIPDLDDFAAVGRYMEHPAATEAQRSAAATARAIGGVQGDSINQHLGGFISGPREALQSILDNTGRPESLQTTEIQVKKLRKQLADAQSPAERERLGYELTRKQLLLMHARGEG